MDHAKDEPAAPPPPVPLAATVAVEGHDGLPSEAAFRLFADESVADFVDYYIEGRGADDFDGEFNVAFPPGGPDPVLELRDQGVAIAGATILATYLEANPDAQLTIHVTNLP